MASNTEFVVMTINAGGARRARESQLTPEKIAKGFHQLISTKIMPDIIAVQESHEVWQSGQSLPLGTSQALAERLGPSYRSYFSRYLDSDSHAHPNKWKADGPFAGFERVKQGNAVITNKALSKWLWGLPSKGCPGYEKCAPISTQISRATLYSTGNRDTEPRNLIVVPLSLGQKAPEQKCSERKTSLYFMATHLTTLNGEDRHDSRNPKSQEASDVRLAQVREILRIVGKLREAERKENLQPIPIILAGDFNARPCSPELAILERTFVRPNPRWWCDGSDYQGEVWTHVRHNIHVDHIFYNDPGGLLPPVDCFVLGPSQVGNITDHLPVIAKFEIEIQQEDE
jgi:endonuclease/exonuclease/phosphatase family metal-dependent hydrolase